MKDQKPDALTEVIMRHEQSHAEFLAWLRAQPKTIQCDRHPQSNRTLRPEKSGWCASGPVAHYEECSICRDERIEAEVRDQLRRQGVPKTMLHCSFQTWKPRDSEEATNLDFVRRFKIGFLTLLGAIGTGKTHLAISGMRNFKKALFITHSELLRAVRLSYRDRGVEDPIRKCQRTGLLVLDDLSLSRGGKDELPMLHDILDYRYGERLPTILTSNLTWQELKDSLGERLTDRLIEATYQVLTFGGPSHRRETRNRYLDGEKDCLDASRVLAQRFAIESPSKIA